MTDGSNSELNPSIVSKDSFWVVGLEYKGPQKLQVELWNEFKPRMSEIKNRVGDGLSFGVCYANSAMIEKGELEYMAAVAVSSVESIPEGMVSREVRGGEFVIATHKGSVENIMDTIDYLYGKWFPQSGYFPDDREDFEQYDDRFILGSEESKFDICIPIKKK